MSANLIAALERENQLLQASFNAQREGLKHVVEVLTKRCEELSRENIALQIRLQTGHSQ